MPTIVKTKQDSFRLGISDARLQQSFFDKPTVELARALLGKKLVTVVRGVRTAGMIVEVEAYLGDNDPACHTACGETARNAVMFGEPGHCYVYLIYGMYNCVNVVSDPTGVGSAVLIRALEPLEGLETMQRRRRRGRMKERDVTRGPGRLCEALSITTALSGIRLTESRRIWIEPYATILPQQVATSGRIGISQATEKQLRFYLRNNKWVSGPPALRT